jgi:hypothetical protein
MRRATLAAAVFVLAFAPAPRAQLNWLELAYKASEYVSDFERRFGSMVAEERYEQSVRPSFNAMGLRGSRSTGAQQTVLVSDFLLVQVPGEGWMPFRDVFERDGQKVRDREARLARLFIDGSSRSAIEQAKSIMAEGARYNIGAVERNINLPTLPLAFLTDMHRTRFDFEIGKRSADEGTILEFKERTRPTYITTTGGRDLPVSGRFWVDEATGTVRRSEMHAVDTALDARIVVTYQRDATAGLWVPAKMEERYRRTRDNSEIYGVATYSKFRKFSVSTSEEIDDSAAKDAAAQGGTAK